MNNFIGTPFFYIILIGCLVFLYAIIVGISKTLKAKKKAKKSKEKADSEDQKKNDVNDKVETLEEFKNKEAEVVKEEVVDEALAAFTDEAPVKSFEDQALDFLNDSENDSLLNDFFGMGASDLFKTNEEPAYDYTIKEYDYNKIWEYEPAPIDYNYNYDVNYQRPKHASRLRTQFKKMNKTQRAMLFANILAKQK